MSFAAPFCSFVLGFGLGGIGGIALGFVWYEHKCGLLSDRGGKRAAAIWFELDDVFGQSATAGGNGGRKIAPPSRVRPS